MDLPGGQIRDSRFSHLGAETPRLSLSFVSKSVSEFRLKKSLKRSRNHNSNIPSLPRLMGQDLVLSQDRNRVLSMGSLGTGIGIAKVDLL